MTINLILVLKIRSKHIISFLCKFPLCQGDYNLKQRIIWCSSATMCDMLSFSSGKVLYKIHGDSNVMSVGTGNVLSYQLRLNESQTYDIQVNCRTSRFLCFARGHVGILEQGNSPIFVCPH